MVISGRYIQDEPVFNIFFIQNVTIYIQIKVHPNCTETTKTKYDSACLTILLKGYGVKHHF